MQGMGQRGPHSHYATWGPSLMPYAGLTWMWGYPDEEEPVGSQIAHPDYVVPTQTAFAILAALEHRRQTGEGQYIETAQVASVVSLLPTTYLDYFVNRRVAPRQGNSSPWYAPYGCYACAGEDRWCVIAVTNEEQWRLFCAALGAPGWTQGPRFATMPDRVRHREALDEQVAAWTRARSPHEVMELLQRHGVPAGVVQNAQDLHQDPHLQAREMLMRVEHPEMPPLVYPGIPIKLSDTPGRLQRHAPLLGQDNDYVFRELLGMEEAEVAALVERGVIV
jgi:benzylsuccinate CoA-transferase BbsF subunit